MSIPVVRLEVEYMKHSILQAFTEYSAQVDADVHAAVERFCNPENVKRIIDKAVKDTLEHAINEEIRRFYEYGAGQSILKEAVAKHLGERAKYG